MVEKSNLGNRMKAYEKAFIADKAIPLLPVIARLDGKAFHRWTKGLDRPFDRDLITIMQNTMKRLVVDSGAVAGYTQSDEITLVFYSDSHDKQIFFDGKFYKMTSVLSSMCTAYFNYYLTNQIFGECAKYNDNFQKQELLSSKPFALFDCRVFQVPNLEEAVNCLIWREQDATRNSIQMAGHANFSHKQLYKKSTSDIQEMLFQEKGINWNDYEWFEKRGTYARRVVKERKFTCDELARLPEKHEAKSNPDLIVKRNDIAMVELPVLSKINNRIEVIFNGADSVMKE